MKAFLLAAGFGTRLRPITDTTPKCMVPIHGLPLLGWWLDLFLAHGVSEVLVNTHYLYEPVRKYIKEYNEKDTGLKVYEAYEPSLLGSGGTIRNNKSFVEGEEDFLICYADNLTDTDLSEFYKFHKKSGGALTMALFHTNLPKQCGIAAVDKNGLITEFVEKPEEPKSNLANAGMYIATNEIFEYLKGSTSPIDFGKDVLPNLIGKMYGWYTDGYIRDIGTMENYEKANKEWPYDNYKNTPEN